MLRVFLSTICLVASLTISNAAPKVVVSIKPIHSLVAGIMEDIGEPELLLNGALSPHDYSLKPSQAQSLQDADLVIWVGESLETFLIKPIGNLNSETKALEILEIDGLTLHEYRELNEHTEHETDNHEHDEHNMDPHLWLDISNALKIVNSVAARLTKIDPENKIQYENNASKIATKLNDLKASISLQLQGTSEKNYIVFHDAYQYFEKHFDLAAPTPITIHPEIPLGAARIKEVQSKIAEHGISCLFSEPQFSPTVIKVIAENSDAKISVLDPLGSEIEVGSNHYFEMMSNLASDFSECLKL